MLALSKNLANCYDKKPYLIARSTTDDTELYFVDEQSLPAQGCDGAPLDLLDKREIHSIRSKWKVGKRTFSKIRRALKEQKEEFDLTSDEENEENVRCCIEDIENGVLNKLKREVRVSSKWLPYYDLGNSTKQVLHSSFIGPSSSGKSFLCSEILEANFNRNATDIYILSPTANTDEAYLSLRKKLGAKHVKLIDSGEIKRPIDIEEIARGSVLVVDDVEACGAVAKKFICNLQTRCLTDGRHRAKKLKNGKMQAMTVFSVFHDAFSISTPSIKSSCIESCRVFLFPNLSRSISRKYMKHRLHFTAKEIKKVFDFVRPSDRWMCIYTHVPQLLLCKSSCLLL